MPKIGETNQAGKKLTILGYGDAMSGKTTFIKSIRKVFKGPAYIFNYDMEDNLLPLMGDPASNDIEYDQYDNSKGYDNLVRKIVELRRSCPYKVIVLENLNRMYKHTFDQVMVLANRTEEQGSRLQEWGNTNKKVFDRVKEILDIDGPECIYITTHQCLDKDEMSGKIVGQILIPGRQLPEEIPPMFNLNLHFSLVQVPTKAPEYYVYTKHDGTWKAGDKTGTLDFREKADFVELWKKIGPRFRAVATPAAAPVLAQLPMAAKEE